MNTNEFNNLSYDECKRAIYKSLVDVGYDLKKLVDDCMLKYGHRFQFHDVFDKDEWHGLWYNWMDGKITKEELKAKIREKLAFANTRI